MKPFEYLPGASRRGPFSPGMSGTFAFSLFNTQFFNFYFLLVPAAPLTRHLRFLHPGCLSGTERSRPTFSSRFAPAIEDSDPIGKRSACAERPLLHHAWSVCVMKSLFSSPSSPRTIRKWRLSHPGRFCRTHAASHFYLTFPRVRQKASNYPPQEWDTRRQ